MTAPFDGAPPTPEPSSGDEEHGVRVTDRRRIDPETFRVREPAQPAPAPGSGPVAGSDPAGVGPSGTGPAEPVGGGVDDADARVVELTDDLRRVHAEYANYRKRVDRDRELVRDTAVGGVLVELLPVLDDLDRAREHGELEGAFRTVAEALDAALARQGLERFGAVGEPFDPTVHEAFTHEEREGLDGPTVVTVYQAGYRHAGRVLRPARVGVAE